MIKVLVTYASKYQSTAEIAGRIAQSLGKQEFEVELKPVFAVNHVARYDAVVLGSAVYAGQWMKDAIKFLEHHVDDLAKRPTWIFSSGPTGEGDPQEILDGYLLPEKAKPYTERIHPRDVVLFHGNLDVNRLNFGERLLIKAIHAQTGDFRNWQMIDQWAEKIATGLNEELKILNM